MELKEIGWEVVDWIDMDKNKEKWQEPVKTVTSLPVPYLSG
jgi:hypothetical protein